MSIFLCPAILKPLSPVSIFKRPVFGFSYAWAIIGARWISVFRQAKCITIQCDIPTCIPWDINIHLYFISAHHSSTYSTVYNTFREEVCASLTAQNATGVYCHHWWRHLLTIEYTTITTIAVLSLRKRRLAGTKRTTTDAVRYKESSAICNFRRLRGGEN